MSKKRPLTRDEWRQVGVAMRQAQAELWKATELVQKTMPIAMADRIIRAHDRLGDIKSDLENEMMRQHPDWIQEDWASVFFGADQKAAS